MKKGLMPKKIVEDSNIVQGIRKVYTKPNLKTHTVLTDDAFTYVDFFFKKNPRRLLDCDGRKINQNYLFYWTQAKNFYQAAKMLPIEAAPLPMYYSMLNAVKAYILYHEHDTDRAQKSLSRHGLGESKADYNGNISMENIGVHRYNYGVFQQFSNMIQEDFEEAMLAGKNQSYSIKELAYNLPFIHNAYISTYDLKRREEHFVPLVAGEMPTFYYCNDNRIHLVIKLQKSYFKRNAVAIPEDILQSIPFEYEVSTSDPFCLISSECYLKKELKEAYNKYRGDFTYVAADNRLWYLVKRNIDNRINDMSSMLAIAHRLSEIVRYKPEEMVELLKGKENWLLHEYMSLALDQFIDGIASEITKREIMRTRRK